MQTEQAEQWIGRAIVDADGEKVGKLNEIHFLRHEPLVGEVRRGRFGRRIHLVPLSEAIPTGDEIRLPYRGAAIAAAAGPSSDGTVGAAELDRRPHGLRRGPRAGGRHGAGGFQGEKGPRRAPARRLRTRSSARGGGAVLRRRRRRGAERGRACGAGRSRRESSDCPCGGSGCAGTRRGATALERLTDELTPVTPRLRGPQRPFRGRFGPSGAPGLAYCASPAATCRNISQRRRSRIATF